MRLDEGRSTAYLGKHRWFSDGFHIGRSEECSEEVGHPAERFSQPRGPEACVGCGDWFTSILWFGKDSDKLNLHNVARIIAEHKKTRRTVNSAARFCSLNTY
jgi:hypothetical protein